MQGKVDSRAMREVNRSIVLDMIRRDGRVSRTDLARRSALTKPTVSAIVEDLIAAGIVHEVGFGQRVRNGGRRARLLEFNESSAAYLGVRFGVHTTTVAISDARGVIRATRDVATVAGDAVASVESAAALVDDALAAADIPRKRLQAVGVAVGGLVDFRTGVCVLSPNLGWKDFALRDALESRLELPVVVNNVTDAAALAEGRLGAAMGVRSYVWVYVGTGIGAGIVIDGQVFYGHRGFSGEIGHCRMGKGGPILEDVASLRALVERAHGALAGGTTSSLSDCGAELSAFDVIRVARSGDSVAAGVVAEAARHLGVGISYLLNILNPEQVVLGGPMIEAGESLFEPLRESVAAHALSPEGVRIVPTALGDRAATAGAVLAAMDHSVQSLRVVAAAPLLTAGRD
jgi:predicted NBD/HSP70 family sugar kinase